MTLEELKIIIESLGIPCAYGYFRDKKPPAYIVYSETMRNAIYADGIVVYAEPFIMLQLYTKTRSLATERLIEGALSANKIAYDSPDYEFDESQEIHIATYYFPI
jgi:hypothetical protein